VSAPEIDPAPPEGTLQRWCLDYLQSTELEHKLSLALPPTALWTDAPAIRLTAPGRPPELVVTARAKKAPGPDAIRDPRRRAELLHTFFHHELQAAELLLWAVLAFPETPPRFRRGLVAIAREEILHMRLYRDALVALGSHVGAFPVRDWFWLRLPTATSPAAFVATLGVGLEGGNLDHAARFAERFDRIGDHDNAALQRRIGKDEIRHVRFAAHWLRRFTGELDFNAWLRLLVPPISPALLRGEPIEREARAQAGLPEVFIDALAAFQVDVQAGPWRAPGS
jgi:uncharacterized ferritin-like protein (DUF455 family)